jgi:hypothetical protein
MNSPSLRDTSKLSDLLEDDKRCLEIAYDLGICKNLFTVDGHVKHFSLHQKYNRLNLHHRCFTRQVNSWRRRKRGSKRLVWDAVTDPVFEYIISRGGEIPDTIVKDETPRFPSLPNDRTIFRDPKPLMGSEDSSEDEHYDPPLTHRPRPAAKPKKAPSTPARALPLPQLSRLTMSEPPGATASELSFSLEALGLSFNQVNKFREFRAIDPDNPQNMPPGVQAWITSNQQVEVDGLSKTVTKFSVLCHAGSDISALAIYGGDQGLKAKLELNGYGLSVPVPSLPPDYIRYKDLVHDTALATAYDSDDDAIDDKGQGAWLISVSFFHLFCPLLLASINKLIHCSTVDQE